jgi:hypothetical protein
MLRLTYLCLFLAISSASHAAIVFWGADSNGFDSANGNDVAVGSLVRIGTFNLSDADIAQNAQNIPFLEAAFTEFGSTTIGNGGNAAGHFQAQTSNNTATANTLAGAQIYVWAFSSGTVAGSMEHGIFYMPKATDVDWQFPIQQPIPGNTQIEMSDLTDGAQTALRAEARVLIGAFGPGTSGTTGKPNFTLQAVPEPSSFVLLATMATGVFGFVRRRRS